jgi:hypothetical protein
MPGTLAEEDQGRQAACKNVRPEPEKIPAAMSPITPPQPHSSPHFARRRKRHLSLRPSPDNASTSTSTADLPVTRQPAFSAPPSPPSSSPAQPNPHPHHRTQRRKRGKSLAMAIPTMRRNNSSSNCSLRSYSSAGEVRATCYAASMTCSTPVHGFHYSTTGANGVDWRA